MHLDIPDFLKLSPEERRGAWVGRKLTKPRTGSVTRLKVEDAQTRAFRRELEKQQAKKKAERLAMLRETYGSRKAVR